MTLFRMEDIYVTNMERPILRGISIEVQYGSNIMISGPSGAGKSTLLRLFNRLVDPSQGRVFFNDTPLTEYELTGLRRQVALVFQEPLLFCDQVREELLFPFTLRRYQGQNPSLQELDHVLTSTMLSPSYRDRPTNELSGGEKQRVAIARTLLLKPQVLLLDEPTSALDEELTMELIPIILTYHKPLALIIVSHAAALSKFCNREITITNGTITKDLSKENQNGD